MSWGIRGNVPARGGALRVDVFDYDIGPNTDDLLGTVELRIGGDGVGGGSLEARHTTSSPARTKVVLDSLNTIKTKNIVLDPVMVAKGGTELIDQGSVIIDCGDNTITRGHT